MASHMRQLNVFQSLLVKKAQFHRRLFHHCQKHFHGSKITPLSNIKCIPKHPTSFKFDASFNTSKAMFLASSDFPRYISNYAADTLISETDINEVTTETVNNTKFEYKTVLVSCISDSEPDPCHFHVSYVDFSECEPHADQPVVYGIHGTPGSCRDLFWILKPLAAQGFRVLLPDFPGFGNTEPVTEKDYYHFKHTVAERTDLAVNFLKAVGVKSVDLLVGHSSGGYPVTSIAKQEPHLLRAMMLICPGTGQISPMPIFPVWYIKLVLKLWESGGFWKRFTEAVANVVVKFIPLPFRNMEDARVGARILTGIDTIEMPKMARSISLSMLPVTYIYCDGDPVLKTSRSKEYASMFGIDRSNTDVYDSKANLVKIGTLCDGDHKKGVIFKRRTHHPPGHEDLCTIIIDETFKLYEASKSQNSQERET